MTTNTKTPATPGAQAQAKTEGTVSERFTATVLKEFGGLVGKMEMSTHQKRLAQHLFVKIDTSLKELEKKRQSSSKDFDKAKPPIAWENVNMQKLAVDAVHRIELGLDALIPNHISIIPYLNGRSKKYDIDLRIGYEGKDYYRREVAIDKPIDIVYELVYQNDKFRPIKKSLNSAESYEFDIPQPFDRGNVIGGFGYIVYADSSKNKLVLLSEKDFLKSKSKAQSSEFWENHPENMRYKTIVNRTTSKLQIDPAKVTASFAAVERDEDLADRAAVSAEIEEKANQGPVTEMAQAAVETEALVEAAEPDPRSANPPGENFLYDYDKCNPCLNRPLCKILSNPAEIDNCKGVYKSGKAGF